MRDVARRLYTFPVDYRENAAPPRFSCPKCGAQRPKEESVYTTQGELVGV